MFVIKLNILAISVLFFCIRRERERDKRDKRDKRERERGREKKRKRGEKKVF